MVGQVPKGKCTYLYYFESDKEIAADRYKIGMKFVCDLCKDPLTASLFKYSNLYKHLAILNKKNHDKFAEWYKCYSDDHKILKECVKFCRRFNTFRYALCHSMASNQS